MIRLRTELKHVRADNEQLKLEAGTLKLEKDVLYEDLHKLIDRERNLTDRLLDRQLGSPSSPSSQTGELKNIGSRRTQWGQVSSEYEAIKRREASEARVAAQKDADAKKAMWDRKVAEIDSFDKNFDKSMDSKKEPSLTNG